MSERDHWMTRMWQVERERIARVLAIEPEHHATKSRDYGRGFSEAIRLVREALNAERCGRHAWADEQMDRCLEYGAHTTHRYGPEVTP